MRKVKRIIQYMRNSKHKLLIMVLMNLLFVSTVLLSPLVVQFVIDNVIKNEPSKYFFITNEVIVFFRNNLWLVAILIVGINLFGVVVQFLRGKANADTSETMVENLRNDLYNHIQYLPYSYHGQSSTGDLIQRCTSDVDTIRRFISIQISEFVYALLTIIIAASIMISIHPTLTMLSLITMPFLIAYGYFFFKRMQKAFRESDESEAKFTTILQENIEGTRVVKAFNKEVYEVQKFEKQNRDYQQKTTHMITLLAQYWGISDMIVLLQGFITVLFGILYTSRGEISVGEFVVFSAYIGSILYPIRNMGRILSDFGKVSVSMDRLLEILDESKEDIESGLKPEIKGNIVFDSVSFKYDDGNNNILMDLSFEIKQGQTVAIMGPTGSGKSSLIHLLTRLYDYQGHILLDGIELKDISRKHLRKHIGLVLQEPFLFSKSIYDNIKLAHPNATKEDVKHAATIANIDDVIEGFDQGYDTMVGEKGVTLSGGQKQRVAIARVIINQNPILIFDDSLSAVDVQTDANIRRKLESLSHKTTTILITHRVNSAQNADKILVLENGKISQEGTHSELLQQAGLYQEIAKIQQQVVTKEVNDVSTDY